MQLRTRLHEHIQFWPILVGAASLATRPSLLSRRLRYPLAPFRFWASAWVAGEMPKPVPLDFTGVIKVPTGAARFNVDHSILQSLVALGPSTLREGVGREIYPNHRCRLPALRGWEFQALGIRFCWLQKRLSSGSILGRDS
jgi:hypothetical protein